MSYAAQHLRKQSGFRSLDGLADVRANGRILNLGGIARELAASAGAANPSPVELFANAGLNRAIFVKHNVRENERYLFSRPQPVTTKVILPTDRENLSLGGVTFMLGERQAERVLREKLGLNRQSTDDRVQRDLRILDIIDSLATLDPFIVRERVAPEGVQLPEAFAAFQLEMDHDLYEFMRTELTPPIRAALSGTTPPAGPALQENVLHEILNGKDIKHSDALRAALGIEAIDWPAVLFAWKVALGYELSAAKFEPRWGRFIQSLQCAKLHGFSHAAPAEAVLPLRTELLERLRKIKVDLDCLLAAFNHARREGALAQGTPDAFREYLTTLRGKVYNFGVALGVLEQVASYWEYWFIARGMTDIPAESLMTICKDLLTAVATMRISQSAAPADQPTA